MVFPWSWFSFISFISQSWRNQKLYNPYRRRQDSQTLQVLQPISIYIIFMIEGIFLIFINWSYNIAYASFSLTETVVFSHISKCYFEIRLPSPFTRTSLVAKTVKNLPAMQETRTWFLGQEDPLDKGIATHSSILARNICQTEEPGELLSMGSQRVGYDWVANTHKQIDLRLNQPFIMFKGSLS